MNTVKRMLVGFFAIFLLLNLSACSSNKKKNSMQNSSAAGNNSSVYDSGPNNGLGSGDYNDSPVEGRDSASVGGLKSIFYFGFDQDELTDQARSDLTAQAERLRAGNDAIRLEGHADELGSREYNMALSERRAKSVVSFLSAQGVSSSRFDIVAYGEEKPAAEGNSESALAANRRVELK